MTTDKKLIQEHWTKHAPGLEKGLDKNKKINREFFEEIDSYRYSCEPYIPKLIDSFEQKGAKILEIGCGMGYDSRVFAKKGMVPFCSDLSFDNVKHTREGFEFFNLKGSYLNSDAESLPFKDNSFDIIYSFGVLHHTPNTQEAIDEIFRVLKPGGKCIIMLYHKGYAYLYIMVFKGWFFLKRLFMTEAELISKYYDFTPLSKMYSTSEAKKLFKEYADVQFQVTTNGFGGWVDKRLRWLHFLFHRLPFLLRLLGSFLIIRAKKKNET